MSNTNEISKEDWEKLAQDLQSMPGQHYSEEIVNPSDREQQETLEELIKIEHIDEYTEKIRFFWSELVELNTILYLAEKIAEFPLNLFRPTHHSGHIFLGTVMDSFYQSAILLISRLATDQGKEIYTLFQLKGNLLREWLTEKGKQVLRERLAAIDAGNIQKIAREKTRGLRDFRYAHILVKSFNPNIEVYHPGLNDLKEICALLNLLFDVLTLHTNYGKLPVHYPIDTTWVQQESHKPDFEEIFDGIAQQSSLLNLPETNHYIWQMQKQNLSNDDKEKFNFYRRKFNLPEIDFT